MHRNKSEITNKSEKRLQWSHAARTLHWAHTANPLAATVKRLLVRTSATIIRAGHERDLSETHGSIGVDCKTAAHTTRATLTYSDVNRLKNYKARPLKRGAPKRATRPKTARESPAPALDDTRCVATTISPARVVPPDQSDAGSASIFARRTNQAQEARVYSHDGPIRRRKR
eukprot:1187761-Prorocentrum_minimum.AAC.1